MKKFFFVALMFLATGLPGCICFDPGHKNIKPPVSPDGLINADNAKSTEIAKGITEASKVNNMSTDGLTKPYVDNVLSSLLQRLPKLTEKDIKEINQRIEAWTQHNEEKYKQLEAKRIADLDKADKDKIQAVANAKAEEAAYIKRLKDEIDGLKAQAAIAQADKLFAVGISLMVGSLIGGAIMTYFGIAARPAAFTGLGGALFTAMGQFYLSPWAQYLYIGIAIIGIVAIVDGWLSVRTHKRKKEERELAIENYTEFVKSFNDIIPVDSADPVLVDIRKKILLELAVVYDQEQKDLAKKYGIDVPLTTK